MNIIPPIGWDQFEKSLSLNYDATFKFPVYAIFNILAKFKRS